MVRVVAFFVVFFDVFLAVPALPAAFVAVLLVTLVFEVLFLEGFFTTFFLVAFFLADFFPGTFFLTTFFFVTFFFEVFFFAARFLEAFFFAVFFFAAFFFATFFFTGRFAETFFFEVFFLAGFLADAVFFAALRAAFFFAASLFAALLRALDVVLFREGLFLAAICFNPDGDKITAALYICGRVRKGFRQDEAGCAGLGIRRTGSWLSSVPGIGISRRVNRLFSAAPSRLSRIRRPRWCRCRPGR